MPQTTFAGSCLCGAVHYELSGDPQRFYHCHCRRCRKATGTGHATNMMVEADGIQWLSGEQLLTCYKVPEAERFTTCFCKLCGSKLPRFVADMGMVVIPAGSLDTEPGIAPQARIFWESRADWSCGAGELPIFAEYPPRN